MATRNTFWTMAVYVLILLSGVVLLVGVPGCQTDPSAVAALLGEANAAIEILETKIDEQKAQLDAIADPDERAKALATLTDMEAVLGDIKGYRDKIVLTPEGSIDVAATATGFSGMLPFPFNIIAGVGIGALAEWWRNRKPRASFTGLVNALNRAKSMLPEFATAMTNAAPIINGDLDRKERELITRMRKNGGKIPILA